MHSEFRSNRNSDLDAETGNGPAGDDAPKIGNSGGDQRLPIGNRVHFRRNMSLQPGIDLLEKHRPGRNHCHQVPRAAMGFLRFAIAAAEIDAEDRGRSHKRFANTVKPDRNLGRQPAPGEGGCGIERTGQIIGENQQHGQSLQKSCNVLPR